MKHILFGIAIGAVATLATPAFAQQPPPEPPEITACQYLLNQGTAREYSFATATVAGRNQAASLQGRMADAEKVRVETATACSAKASEAAATVADLTAKLSAATAKNSAMEAQHVDSEAHVAGLTAYIAELEKQIAALPPAAPPPAK